MGLLFNSPIIVITHHTQFSSSKQQQANLCLMQGAHGPSSTVRCKLRIRHFPEQNFSSHEIHVHNSLIDITYRSIGLLFEQPNNVLKRWAEKQFYE